MPLAARQQQLIDDLGFIPDRQERLALIVDRARKIPRFTIADRTSANTVQGCISPVWIIGNLEADGTIGYRCDAESPLVKGLVALLCQFYSGARPEAIATTEPAFLDDLGLVRDLSPTRRNGVAAVRRRIREIALAFSSTADNPPAP